MFKLASVVNKMLKVGDGLFKTASLISLPTGTPFKFFAVLPHY